MPYHIAFDVAHKPRGRIDDNLSEVRDQLNSNGFVCYNFLEVPITEESLMPYDILVFVCPDFSRITANEITQIVKWVKNSGGGLLLLSHAGGDKGRGSNLSEISEQFGIAFENDQVLDETKNLGMENIPIVSTFNIPHPITANIDTLCYRSGCSLSIMGSGAFSIVDSNETSEPFSCPLVCVTEINNGRVCCIGSYEMFRDKIGGGFQCSDHPSFSLNVFKWLVSDYRMELRSKEEVPIPISQTETISSELEAQPEVSPSTPPSEPRSEGRRINIDFSMRISKKSELIELLKIFQNQIGTIKNTIDKLIEKSSELEDDIIEINSEAVSKNQTIDTQLSEVEPPKEPELKSEETGSDETELTALPPKPEILSKEREEELKPPPKLKTKAKTEKELKDEREGLRTKLNSVQDLLDFVTKRHSSGKIDDTEYSKRTKKLENDIKKTKKKISVLDKLLEK